MIECDEALRFEAVRRREWRFAGGEKLAGACVDDFADHNGVRGAESAGKRTGVAERDEGIEVAGGEDRFTGAGDGGFAHAGGDRNGVKITDAPVVILPWRGQWCTSGRSSEGRAAMRAMRFMTDSRGVSTSVNPRRRAGGKKRFPGMRDARRWFSPSSLWYEHPIHAIWVENFVALMHNDQNRRDGTRMEQYAEAN